MDELSTREIKKMEIKRLWEVILRRKWIIIQVFVVVFSIIIVGTLLKTPTYEAKCNVLIEQQGTQEALLRSIGMEEISEIVFAMNLGQKSSVVIVEMLKMLTKPILDEVVKRMDLRNEKGELRQGPAIKVVEQTFFWYPLYGVAVKPSRQSNMMTVCGYSPDPQEAIDFCNTLCQVYLESDIEAKHKETAEAARFAEEQSIKAKADWNEAKRKLKEYQESEGLVDFNTEADIIINQVSKLRADQGLLNLAMKEIDNYDSPIIDPYLIGGNTLSNAGQISQLKTSLAQLESDLESNLTKYTENHPIVIALKKQISDLEQKLISEKEVFKESGTTRYAEIQKQINDYKRQLLDFPEKLYTLAQLSLQSDTYEKVYEMLLDMKYRLNISKSMQISKLTIIEPAWKAKVFSPNIDLNLIIAIALGIVLGFGLAFMIEYLDDTIKDAETIQFLFKTPLLATVPLMSKKDSAILGRETEDDNRRSMHFLNEAFNVMSYNIKLGSIDKPVRHVMITSSAPSEGKTAISSNLGINLARKGKRVVIVDTDFPRPSIYKVFKISNEKGLTNVLLGENTIEEVTIPSGTENLFLITTGPKPPSASLLFESRQMKEVIKALEEKFDFVIFDTPPVLTINDPVVLGSYIDKTILVVAANEISRQIVKEGLNTLQKGRGNLLGIVLNKFRHEGSHYYYYYYSYHEPEEGNGFKKLISSSLAMVGFKSKGKRRHKHRRTYSDN